MLFSEPLIKGKLIKRYKRFMADILLENNEVITAHCANSGSMLTVKPDNAPVWVSISKNPKRKLKYTWEIIEINGCNVGINTSHPNQIVADAIEDHKIAGIETYNKLRREVKYGENSRIDILLENDEHPDCYIEVKNVTMKRDECIPGRAEFPDGITARGTKHLIELSNMVAEGHRAIMFYLVQRNDCNIFSIANDIDNIYYETLLSASQNGVEIMCYSCEVTSNSIELIRPVQVDLLI